MAKKIMIQGTMSNAGKSLICAGLCRIFHQDGYKVAPFKSQNMALNSYITEDGLEMGRAQVVQAEAAGIAPRVEMNPILLKPTNDTGSQVIVNGEVLENMSARDYFAYKKKLVPDILQAFHTLEENYDIIVIEGAGSPAEINLKQDDIVNMGLAKMVDAPVLLVGDIDRGGVFAQLLGTLMLLEEDEKERVKGLIINKFRGDKTILDPGIEMLEERGKIPVVGVTPYLQIEIEDEDSLTERFQNHKYRTQMNESHVNETQMNRFQFIDIAVIRTPRISNFTDFLVLENLENVCLRYVTSSRELGYPDMILLPGTKNTMEDLLWMRQNGLEGAVLKAAARGTVIWGICGGYQMLGKWLYDPEGVETGAGRKIAGMGLLPMQTTFTGEKTRTRVEGTFAKVEGSLHGLEGMSIEGYEIHMGETIPCTEDKCAEDKCTEDKCTEDKYTERRNIEDACEDVCTDKKKMCMCRIADRVTGLEGLDGMSVGNVYGTYVHGIFDAEGVASAVVRALAEKKGMDIEWTGQADAMSYQAFKETQYDLLADALREHLDMEMIYQIME